MNIDNLVKRLTTDITSEEIIIADNWIKGRTIPSWQVNHDCVLMSEISYSLCNYLINTSEDRECSSTVWRDFITSIHGRYYALFHGYLEEYGISDFNNKDLLIKAYKALSIFQVLVMQSKRTKIQVRGSKGGLTKSNNSLKNYFLRSINLIKELLPYLEACKNYDPILLVNYLVEKDYYYCMSESIYSYNYPIEKYIKDCTGIKGKLNLGQCANGREIRDSLKFALKEIINNAHLGRFCDMEDEVKKIGLKILKKHRDAACQVFDLIEK